MHQNSCSIFVFDIQVLGPHREEVNNLMKILLCGEHDWVEALRVVAILSQIALVIHQLQQLDVLFGDADENRRQVFLGVRSIIIQLDLLHHKKACAFRSVVQDGIREGTHFRLFIQFVHQPFLLFLATLFCVHDHDVEYLIVAIVSCNLKGRHAIVSLYIHRIVRSAQLRHNLNRVLLRSKVQHVASLMVLSKHINACFGKLFHDLTMTK